MGEQTQAQKDLAECKVESEAEKEALKQMFERTFAGENIKTLAYIAAKLCGYRDLSSLRMDGTGRVDTEATMYTEGRASILRAIKQCLCADTICLLEREILAQGVK